jgi:hypothetical protein
MVQIARAMRSSVLSISQRIDFLGFMKAFMAAYMVSLVLI